MQHRIHWLRAPGWSRARGRTDSRLSLTLALTLAATLTAAACSAMFERPRVHLTDVRVGGLGLRGATVIAELAVVNPNSFDVEMEGLTYDLEISDPAGEGGWTRFAEGSWDERLRVRSGDSVSVDIPIEFGYSQMGAAVRSMLDRGTFDYRVEGTVEVRDPVRRTVPYRHQGKFTLQATH